MRGEAHSGNQNVLIVEDLMSPTTKAVLLIRIKSLGSMKRKHVVQNKVSYASILKQTSLPPPGTHLISQPNKLYPL